MPGVVQICLHKDELDVMATGSVYKTAAWITPSEVIPKPAQWNAAKYHVEPVPSERLRGVQEGDLIDLGDKKVEVKINSVRLHHHHQLMILGSAFSWPF